MYLVSFHRRPTNHLDSAFLANHFQKLTSSELVNGGNHHTTDIKL